MEKSIGSKSDEGTFVMKAPVEARDSMPEQWAGSSHMLSSFIADKQISSEPSKEDHNEQETNSCVLSEQINVMVPDLDEDASVLSVEPIREGYGKQLVATLAEHLM